MSDIHSTALVETGAQLGPDVQVGPFAIIEAGAELGPGCVVEPHARIYGCVRLGARNVIGTGAVLGGPAQHRDGSRPGGLVVIGDGNTFGEYSTVHRPAKGDATRLGHRNWLMAYSHVGHDCMIGNGNVFANGVQLGGHVVVGDGANLGGLAGVHQFVRIGDLAMIGALSVAVWDVPPYAAVEGRPARIHSLNLVGLKRASIAPNVIRELHTMLRAYRQQELAPLSREGQRLLEFLRATGKRGITPWCREG
ncbi:MAG: acyl-ACP--UDP-N-acetylglucosamine O-acyltransferase [Deinococcus sp.]|nr:acyl-ACP--UDP-N-acetylglucosamine O-acyltransferase [Deinococcus sp.]